VSPTDERKGKRLPKQFATVVHLDELVLDAIK
jgi:hypothetical protein